MNISDSEKISGLLETTAFEETAINTAADLIILNTCCVREKAEEKLRGKLGEINLLKKNNPNLMVGIGGCMMQQKDVSKKILQRFPYVDFVFGPHTIDQLLDLIEKASQKRTSALLEDRFDVPLLPQKRSSKFRAWTTIIKGCNNYCSYCIVPYVRGREVSRPYQEILEEIKQGLNEGVKEVVLLGQNVNAYQDKNINFPALLEKVNQFSSIERIRFMTSHPRDFSLDFVKRMSQLEKVCPHYHLPIQSGSNRILEKMNRGYTREHYLELVDELRKYNADLSITTDIIVGFPGEDDWDFKQTLTLMQQIRFDSAFIFLYSPRQGTAALNLTETVALSEKKKRFNLLSKEQEKISLEINQKLINQKLTVICEGSSKKNSQKLMGRTAGNRPLIFEASNCEEGEKCLVKVEDYNANTLFGSLIEKLD